jgi:hypothetical protein
MMHGIPLGSQGGPPTAADLSVHIALAAIATLTGARTAIRISRGSPLGHALAVALVLGVVAIRGFGKPASNWPDGFGVAMAAACLAGATTATRWRSHRSESKNLG